MVWRALFYDPATYLPLGEIVDMRKFLINTGTAMQPVPWSVNIDIDVMNEMAGYLTSSLHLSTMREPLPILALYRYDPRTSFTSGNDTWLLEYAGEVTSGEVVYNESQKSISFSASDPTSRFETRVANNEAGDGKKITGWKFPDGTPINEIARTMIEKSLVVDGNHWVRADVADTNTTDVLRAGITFGMYSMISDVIPQLSMLGFEHRLDYGSRLLQDGLASDFYGLILAHWKSAGVIGVDRSDSVLFEYGLGQNNCTGFRSPWTIQGFANRITSVLPDQHPVVLEADRPEVFSSWGVREAPPLTYTIKDAGMREKMITEWAAVRSSGPQIVFEVTLQRSDETGFIGADGNEVGTCPIPFLDYNIGDIVRVRIACADTTFATPENPIDTTVRIYGIQVDVSPSGAEVATLTLSPS